MTTHPYTGRIRSAETRNQQKSTSDRMSLPEDGRDSGLSATRRCPEPSLKRRNARLQGLVFLTRQPSHFLHGLELLAMDDVRSEARRVGKECRSRWSPYH